MSKESVIEHLTEENNRLREELEKFKTAGVETHTDYRILIAALRADNEICTADIDDCENCPQKRLCMHEYLIPAAADAIEKLLELLDYEKLHADTFFDEARKFEKELERVKAERDGGKDDKQSDEKAGV